MRKSVQTKCCFWSFEKCSLRGLDSSEASKTARSPMKFDTLLKSLSIYKMVSFGFVPHFLISRRTLFVKQYNTIFGAANVYRVRPSYCFPSGASKLEQT